MSKYYFDEKNRFVVEDYNNSRPFASFLPGIAGKEGIPIWVFYVNRAQCISSFGISSKDKPILEFYPAIKAYHTVFKWGFRTFIKLRESNMVYEAFSKAISNQDIIQRMYIGRNELEIEETNKFLGLNIRVLYYILPKEKIGALIRRVSINNLSNDSKNIEILDGLCNLIPYGINDFGLKNMINTLKAWMEVYNLENNVPIFKLKSTTEDIAKVSEFKEGNFFASFIYYNGKYEIIKPIVDPDVIFGMDTSLNFPENFAKMCLEDLINNEQITYNKIPCAFSPILLELPSENGLTIYSIIGHIPETSLLYNYVEKFSDPKYFDNKYEEGNKIIEEIVSDVFTKTSSRLFDEYTKQSYLDNVLRGGYPVILKEGNDSLVYYIYSRKHGDLERDYNYFVIFPEYYSSGNANFRDVNQNRRDNVFFHPELGTYDIRFFMNLIQTDGYNPLVINGVKYRIKGDIANLLNLVIEKNEDKEKLKNFLMSGNLTPGKILSFIENNNIKLMIKFEKFLTLLSDFLEEEIDAIHGEGFWTDHWTYNIDLIESYLEIYPEKKRFLFFEDYSYTYYDNTFIVLPRNKRYVLKEGKIRQLNFLVEDPEKKKLIESRVKFKNVMRKEKGKGDIYKTNLITKLINLAGIKFATIDPAGIGIEMEAGRPGWYDALNGLPGLFGSSVAETCELLRLFELLIEVMEENPEIEIKIPKEVYNLIEKEVEETEKYFKLDNPDKDHKFWDIMSDLRENYREETKLGFEGIEIKEKCIKLSKKFMVLKEKIAIKLKDAMNENGGFMSTYYYYDPEEYEVITDDNPFVKINKFRKIKMPLFLEGIVKSFRIYKDKEILREIYKKVKESELFDKKLKMYKLNTSLKDQPIEVGRAKVFTPGWLENESIWIHMEYKYILELIKRGLYNEFFDDFKNIIIAFIDPAIYGRSPLENSSFIVSSSYPDDSIHGGGFVARLSGATAEFLSIWRLMMAGKNPFKLVDGKLILSFSPIIPGWLFDEDNKVSFNFLGKCIVNYYNPKRTDTFKLDLKNQKISIQDVNGKIIEIKGNIIEGELAKLVREGMISKIDIYLS